MRELENGSLWESEIIFIGYPVSELTPGSLNSVYYVYRRTRENLKIFSSAGFDPAYTFVGETTAWSFFLCVKHHFHSIFE